MNNLKKSVLAFSLSAIMGVSSSFAGGIPTADIAHEAQQLLRWFQDQMTELEHFTKDYTQMIEQYEVLVNQYKTTYNQYEYLYNKYSNLTDQITSIRRPQDLINTLNSMKNDYASSVETINKLANDANTLIFDVCGKIESDAEFCIDETKRIKDEMESVSTSFKNNFDPTNQNSYSYQLLQDAQMLDQILDTFQKRTAEQDSKEGQLDKDQRDLLIALNKQNIESRKILTYLIKRIDQIDADKKREKTEHFKNVTAPLILHQEETHQYLKQFDPTLK